MCIRDRVYDAQKTGNDASDLVNECVIAIDDLYEQLDAVNEQISAMLNRTICKNCGAENPQSANFCSKCGHKRDDPEDEVPSPEADDSQTPPEEKAD